MIMYSELEKEFNQPMKEVGLDFKNEYTQALRSFEDFAISRDEKRDAIRSVLQALLEAYSKTKPKTKVGRWARFFAKILSLIKINKK